jgi:radical SAM enzyme (TIGR01210 family)
VSSLALDPFRPYLYLAEEECSAGRTVVPVNAVFLTNRRCPWNCVMCDLWQNTLTDTVPVGAIPAQIDYALSQLPPAGCIKLYNSGSFFDPRAIPVADYPAIARRLTHCDRVVVESHPALISDNCFRFRDLIPGQLEVAMGLETVQPEVLPRLNKQMTLEQFSAAAAMLKSHDIDLRAFILVKPPFTDDRDALFWAQRSLDFAFECGATAASLIPTRGPAPPRIETLEAALEYGLRFNQGRVFADLWDLERFSTCEACLARRAARLREMNLSQTLQEPVECPACGPMA